MTPSMTESGSASSIPTTSQAKPHVDCTASRTCSYPFLFRHEARTVVVTLQHTHTCLIALPPLRKLSADCSSSRVGYQEFPHPAQQKTSGQTLTDNAELPSLRSEEGTKPGGVGVWRCVTECETPGGGGGGHYIDVSRARIKGRRFHDPVLESKFQHHRTAFTNHQLVRSGAASVEGRWQVRPLVLVSSSSSFPGLDRGCEMGFCKTVR